MGAMILPLSVVLLAALILLGLVVAERFPASTWRDGLRELTDAARDTDSRANVVHQEARLEDLLTRDGADVYTGTESFSGLVDVVEKAMDKASDTAGHTSVAIRHGHTERDAQATMAETPASSAGPLA